MRGFSNAVLPFCATIFFSGALAPAFAETQTPDETEARPVEIANSTTFEMTSAINGRTYQIFVAAPAGAEPDAGHPVIYMTDANARFATMTETAREWSRGQRRKDQDAIVVGIGYPDGTNIGKARAFDLTPALGDMETPQGFGGGEEFLRFVLQELKPRIEASYPVDPDREAIFGHSFGGLVALYAMFNQPDAFDAYLVASPSIWWGERFILQMAPRLTPKLETTGVTIRALVTVGELEQQEGAKSPPPGRPVLPGVIGRTQVDDAKAMAAMLAETPGVSSSFVLFEGEGHGTVPPAAVSRSVSFFFNSETDAQQPAAPQSNLGASARIKAPTAEAYMAMTPEERYALRLDVRSWPDEERHSFLAQLKYNLEAGLWYEEQHALHEERNAMDRKHGTSPVE